MLVKLNRDKINIIMARKKMSVTDLAFAYGVSRERMNDILDSQRITSICAKNLAKSLSVYVTEIIEE